MRALIRALRGRGNPPCAAHHWHLQSPVTGRLLQPAGWRCCHCNNFTHASGPAPTGASGTCALTTWPADTDGLEAWMATLRRS